MPDMNKLEINGTVYDVRDPTKAPAGHIDGICTVRTNEEIHAAVQALADTTYDSIVHAVFHVSVTDLELPGGTVFVDIYGSSGSYYTAKAYYYGLYAGTAMEYIGSGYNGVFSGFDCLNPPLIPGEEYRTAERYNGKAVYAKAVLFYTLPENTFKSVWVADGITALVRVEGYCQHTDGDMIQIECNSLISSVKIVGGTNLRIDAGVNASYWSCNPIVYYTKE